MREKTPRRIDDYEIHDLLGEGLTSCVYKAIKTNKSWGVEQTVALKILKSQDQVQTLAQEVLSLSQVDSIHCVKLYGWTSFQGRPVLILEHLEGVTLQVLMDAHHLPHEVIDEIVAQVQQGLMDLQCYGFRHGDLSPRNLFVTKDGIVKLLDFGFSHQQDLEACTLAYLAPEGWENQKLSLESDFFSLGLIQWELKTRERVLTELQSRQRVLKVINQNSLLAEDPSERSPLKISSEKRQRQSLAHLVQNLLRDRLQKDLTVTVHRRTSKVTALKCVRPLMDGIGRILSGLSLFFFCQTLHPASLQAPRQKESSLRLEVRSQNWVHVILYAAHTRGWNRIGEQYTPFLKRGLSRGRYKIQWSSHTHSGSILVQLNKNQRILIPSVNRGDPHGFTSSHSLRNHSRHLRVSPDFQ